MQARNQGQGRSTSRRPSPRPSGHRFISGCVPSLLQHAHPSARAIVSFQGVLHHCFNIHPHLAQEENRNAPGRARRCSPILACRLPAEAGRNAGMHPGQTACFPGPSGLFLSDSTLACLPPGTQSRRDAPHGDRLDHVCRCPASESPAGFAAARRADAEAPVTLSRPEGAGPRAAPPRLAHPLSGQSAPAGAGPGTLAW